MQLFRGEIHDRRDPVGRLAARLFHEIGHGSHFVDHAQPSVFIALPAVRRIEEGAAARQDAVRFRHQRPDPAEVHVLALGAVLAAFVFLDIGQDRLAPVAAVGGVDREFLGRDGQVHLFFRQFKPPGFGVEHEKHGARAEGHRQQGLGTVGDIAGADLIAGGTQEAGRRAVGHGKDREDRADGDIHVDVRRPVQRIGRQGEGAAFVQGQHVFLFFGGVVFDAGAAQRGLEHLVRHHVERLLLVAVAVFPDPGPELACKRTARDHPRQLGPGGAHRLDHGAQVFGNTGGINGGHGRLRLWSARLCPIPPPGKTGFRSCGIPPERRAG